MPPRPPPLSTLDPRAVPLPHGTEVSTRVDRLVGERRIPQGAVGRVVAIREDLYDVQIVGGEKATYRRDELVPRKAGQLRYAHRRAASWAALRGCAVLEATVGSHAWGLAGADSDVDTRGLFVAPFSWTTGLVAPPEDLVSADGSTTMWEIGKGVKQALRADPNTLELLYVDSVRAVDPVGEWILEAREAFVSAELYGTFGRYAISQLKKLQQALRLSRHRQLILEWLRTESLSLDAVASRLASETGLSAPSAADAQHLARDYVKQLYRSLYDQALLPSCDWNALVAFARSDDGSAPFEPSRELRPKNAYNLLRLITTAIRWLREGTPALRVEGAMRDRLLAIKRGEVPLDEVLREAEALTPELEAARRETILPQRADLTRADALLRRVREEMARRWAEQAPGAFGREAPPPPETAWKEEEADHAHDAHHAHHAHHE